MGFEIHEVVNGIDRLIDAKLAAAAAAAKGDKPQKAERLAAVKRARVDLERRWRRRSPRPGAWTSDGPGGGRSTAAAWVAEARRLAWFMALFRGREGLGGRTQRTIATDRTAAQPGCRR